jgi:hypothetical protein
VPALGVFAVQECVERGLEDAFHRRDAQHVS